MEVSTHAVVDCGNGAAVAQMTCDDFQILEKGPAHKSSTAVGDVAMRRSVRSVLPLDLVLLAQFVRKWIHVSRRREGLEEGRVENSDLRKRRRKFLAHLNALERRRIVKRSKRAQAFNLFFFF